MKKNYETPSVDVVKFCYRDQVVAASGSSACGYVVGREGDTSKKDCDEYTPYYQVRIGYN